MTALCFVFLLALAYICVKVANTTNEKIRVKLNLSMAKLFSWF